MVILNKIIKLGKLTFLVLLILEGEKL